MKKVTLPISIIAAMLTFASSANTFDTSGNTGKTGSILNLLGRLNAKEFSDKWHQPVTFNGINYFPLKDIDINAIKYAKTNFPTELVMVGGKSFEIQLPFRKPLEIIRTNEEKLKRGKRPIGGDGEDLRLCTIEGRQSDTYVELSNTQWNDIAKTLGLDNKQPENYCLSNRMSAKYWQYRYSTLVDGMNNNIKNNILK